MNGSLLPTNDQCRAMNESISEVKALYLRYLYEVGVENDHSKNRVDRLILMLILLIIIIFHGDQSMAF